MFKELRHRNLIVLGVASIIFAVCLTCLGLNSQGTKKARTKRTNRQTGTMLVVVASASHTLVKLPPKPADLRPLDCEPTENQVKLSAASTSPHDDTMLFTWQVPVGRLIGKNLDVRWDLSGVQDGTYTATVEVSDRHKNHGRASLAVTVVNCPGFRLDPPPCPVVLVSCPSDVDAKDPVTFVVTVAGGNPETKLTYEWSLTAGKIISGQTTSKLTVDVSAATGKPITATVSVGGVEPACSTAASCTIQIR